MTTYSSTCFKTYESHIEGSNIDIASNNEALFSIGIDDIFCQYTLGKQPKITSISNPNSHQVTKLAIHPENKNFIVAGTQTGHVLKLQTSKDTLNMNSSQTLYKPSNLSSEARVRSLVFTQNGKFLLIATNEPCVIVYDLESKRFFKHKLQNDAQIVSISVDYRNQFFCVIDFEGKASIFQITEQGNEKNQVDQNSDSEDPFASMNSVAKQRKLTLCSSYKITQSKATLFQKGFSIVSSFSFEESFLSQTLYLPGQKTLQKVELNLPPASLSSVYKLSSIFHITEILQVVWLKHEKCGLLLTGTEIDATIWHEGKSEKLMVFDLQSMFDQPVSVKCICPRYLRELPSWGFAIISRPKNDSQTASCKVLDFKGFSQLQGQIANKVDAQMNEQINQIQSESMHVQAMQESRKPKRQNQPRPQNQQSIAGKIMQHYFEFPITYGFQKHNNARFLFYNNVGCIIQRFDTQGQSFLELQFHDRSKITRIKLPSQKMLDHFALCSDTLVYASRSTMYIQNQKQLKEGYQWEYEWENIEGVAIGGDWICGVSKNQIKVWDWAGNQLHSVGFDRKFVGVAAYEDILVVLYHSSFPMKAAQSYKMLVFEVTTKTIKCIRDALVPTKPQNAFKWFGFSQDGMLFCKDDSQNLRAYVFQKDEWIITLALDMTKERLFIQHIQNYEIFGFRLDQKIFNEPKVIPRTLPRKIPFDLSNFKIDYLSVEQNEYIKKHKLSIMWIEHQKFRNARWYKHKYTRTKNNRWYSRSQTIKNEEEINVSQAQLDIKLMEYLKKYIKMNRNQEDYSVWKKVFALCQSLAFYKETRNKLAEIMSEGQLISRSQVDRFTYGYPVQNHEQIVVKKKKLSQLDRLEEMMGLSWVNFRENDTSMAIEN